MCLNEVVVVKDLINSRKHTCTYFKRCWSSCLGLFFAYFRINLYEENMDKAKISFNIEKGV